MPTTATRPVRHPSTSLLSKVPLFSTLPKAHLAKVARLAEYVTYTPGRMVVTVRTPGVAFYAIVSGKAKVVKGKIASAAPEAVLGPGKFFGELALLDGLPRGSSVVAETPLETIRIERTAFRKLLREEPELALKLLEGMSLRIRKILGEPSV